LIKVLHVITGLETGGAEMMLVKLLERVSQDLVSWEVVSLTNAGDLGSRIRELRIPVFALGIRRGLPDPRAITRLVHRLQISRPQVVQTWMYHADLIGGLASKLVGSLPIAWNIRQSDLDPIHSKRLTIWTAKICARLSSWIPTRIVCCSNSAARVHRELGYAAHKMVVLPNGFDVARFKPDNDKRAATRSELGIDKDSPVIGLVARFDPQKDHRTFAEAAAILTARVPAARFVLCGGGVTWQNETLVRWIDERGIRERVHLLGRREDISSLTNAFDIATLSSAYGEGFPNVVGEAMACGVPCVVTDVGDAAWIVGDTGRVVPVRDPRALADAWFEMIEVGDGARQELGARARTRIVEHFDMETIAERYVSLYVELAQAGSARPRV
jgi:glycosyltransferase involved in cell wall biosynthesis